MSQPTQAPLNWVSKEERDLGVSVDLAAVDLVRERLAVGYGEARDALKETEGDVVDALALLEGRLARSDGTSGLAGEVLDEVQQVLQKGPVRALRIRLGSHTIKEIPVHLTVMGALLLGVVAVLATKLVIDVSHDDD